MSYVSLEFLGLVLVSLVLYYALPLKFRWTVLLIGSVLFYAISGPKGLVFAIPATLLAYIVGVTIAKIYSKEELEKVEKKKKAKVFLVAGIVFLIVMLFYSKTCGYAIKALTDVLSGQTLDLIKLVPLGISYYTFALIGYMADVYFEKTKAEKNYLKLLLFAMYFPHIVEGPIPRHKKLQEQLTCGHTFEYERFCFGLQRVGWGLIKKMIIADRASVIVTAVFGDMKTYGGMYIVVALLLSAVQLYCDFSGCMDISIGISQMFGITLDENFQRPFAAKTAAEFWRRWHITLGTWFKDYVYMPVVVSPFVINISSKIRTKYGAKQSKMFVTIVPLLCVWILTGVWHGTGIGYILWGFYWGIIIIVATVFNTELKNINKRLNIDDKSDRWIRWQKFRTFVIFLGGRLLTVPASIGLTWYAVKSMLRTINPWILFDGSLYDLGLNRQNVWCMLFFMILLTYVSSRQEKGVKIRQAIAECPIVIRWAVYVLMVVAIFVFGMYGPGYDTNSFMYAQF